MILQKHNEVQYSSQVTSQVYAALRGMQACEKLARVQGGFVKLQTKPNSPESLTIANLPARLLLRVLAQSWYSLYIKFTAQSIVTCSYNISVPYTVRDCYKRLVGGPVTVLSCSRGSVQATYDSTGGVRQLTKCPASLLLLRTWCLTWE